MLCKIGNDNIIIVVLYFDWKGSAIYLNIRTIFVVLLCFFIHENDTMIFVWLFLLWLCAVKMNDEFAYEWFDDNDSNEIPIEC